MGFLGTIDYLVPCTSLTHDLVSNIDNVIADSQNRPSRFIVQIDSGATDSRATHFLSAYPDRLTMLTWDTPGQKGPAAVRNALAEKSDAEFLLFVDSDIQLGKHFDRQLRDVLVDHIPRTVVYPRIIGRHRNSAVSGFFEEFVFAPRKLADGSWEITSAVFCMDRDTWATTGGFDEAFTGAGGEDWEFFKRIQRSPSNITVDFQPRLIVSHRNPTKLRGLVERAERYARQAHLHTPPPKKKNPVVAGVGLCARLFFTSLLAVNRRIAALGRSGRGLRWLSQMFLGIRAILFWAIRRLRRSSGARDTSWDHLLLVERIRFSKFTTKFFPADHNDALGASTPSKPARSRRKRVQRRYFTSRYNFFRRLLLFPLRLIWVSHYRRNWRLHAELERNRSSLVQK